MSRSESAPCNHDAMVKALCASSFGDLVRGN